MFNLNYGPNVHYILWLGRSYYPRNIIQVFFEVELMFFLYSF